VQDAAAQALSEIASWKTSRLMTFDASSSHVRTHFSEDLVVLLREVRWGWLPCNALLRPEE
jgi:dynein heavy chain 2